MSLLSVLFDNLQRLTVCEYSYEYQEYNTLDELHHLCGKAHHRQTTVQDDVQKRTNDDILKTYLRTTGNRHTAQYQCNQDLGLKLVTTGRSNRTNLDNIDKCGKSCDRTCQCVDKELHAVGTDAGEHRCFLTCSDRL